MTSSPPTVTTWGITFDPFCAEMKAQEALFKGDKRLAHDILWDASNNSQGQNGWCIPDRGSFNDAVNSWPSDKDISYFAISKDLESRGRDPLRMVGNPILRATASVVVLAKKEGRSDYVFEEEVTTGYSETTTIDQKLGMGLGVAFAGIELSVSAPVITDSSLSIKSFHMCYYRMFFEQRKFLS
jgi:hypothetical protein